MLLKKKKDIDEDCEENKDLSAHLDLVRDILENTQANIKKALNLLKEDNVNTDALLSNLQEAQEVSMGIVEPGSNNNSRIIEGVFNGEKMVGGDGVEYNVPANYASKSKLLEGDILKLTISNSGSFIYKQIGPVERKQIVASLVIDENNGDWYALLNKTKWKLLTASVTYFHGSVGDEVVILLPKDSKTRWAAVENIIKSS